MIKYKEEQLKRVERMMKMTDREFYKEYIVKVPEREKKHPVLMRQKTRRGTGN